MKKVAIIGAGISGLFIANLFKKNPNYQIIIYEKNSSIFLEEGYGVQLSVNSIKFLNEIGFKKLQDDEKFNPKKIEVPMVAPLLEIPGRMAKAWEKPIINDDFRFNFLLELLNLSER